MERPTGICNLYGTARGKESLQSCIRPCARRFFIGTWNMKGFLGEERPIQTLRQVIQRLQETYCGTTGFEVGGVRVL